MTAYRYLLFVLLLLNAPCSYSQDTLSKYFTIDTLVFDKGFDINRVAANKDFIGLIRDAHSANRYVAPYWVNDGHGRYATVLKYLRNDSLNIALLMDDKGSAVWLNHLEKLPDTIYISRWYMYHNQLPDVERNWTGYYHYVDDSLVGLYKEKSSQVETKGPADTMLKEINFRLNNVSVRVPLIIEQSGLVSSYHGYVKKNGLQKRYKREVDGKKNVKYNKFAGSKVTKYRLYTGGVNL